MLGEQPRIARRHKQAAPVMLHEFGNSCDARGDHRHSRRHRLHQHHRHSLGKTWKHKHIRLAKQPSHLRRRLIAEELHGIHDSECFATRLQRRSVRPVAGQQQFQVEFRAEHRDGVEQDRQAFYSGEPTDEEEAVLSLFSRRAMPAVSSPERSARTRRAGPAG